MNRVMTALLLALALAGCSSTPDEPETQVVTERQSLNRSAQLAFSQGQYAQAATLYEAALDEALIEDRPEAIIDARFNLALSLTYLGEYRPALEQVIQADAERVRRALGPDPELQLLRATIHYRAGEADTAQGLLEPLLRDPTIPAGTAAKAHFVAGLIAADRGDATGIRRHLDALPSDETPGGEADRLELQGRLAGINGRTDDALHLLDQAIVLRSLDRDFRGMTRVLAVAGDLAEQAGRTTLAGGYLLRAGRSAAQRAEPDARTWLERARDLGKRGGDAALALEAQAMLDQLGAAGRSD
jgi:tetratricopeptide (TPR) repeat protein